MANPLDLRGKGSGDGGGAKHTVDSLHQYCRDMNAMNFVIANGWEYFVNKRTLPNGNTQHYVDRRDGNRSLPPHLVSQAKAALVPSRQPDRHPGYTD